MKNVFTVCNVALDSVVSDMFGKSASLITDYIVNSDTFDPAHCVSLLRGTLKNKTDEVLNLRIWLLWVEKRRFWYLGTMPSVVMRVATKSDL
ncbi:hypothetical protein FACS189492_0820 [Clostridia bacterium]|nr:hypothetical protein FACS189492_0820 [Clostridia bacterium]